MISKVSNQGKMEWVEESVSLRHEGISKSAMDSFTQSLIKEAKKMKSLGASYEDIAKKFNLKLDTLKSILSGDFTDKVTKEASCDDGCESRSQEAKAKGSYLDSADAAYEALRGSRSASALPKDFVPSQRRILSARGGRTDVTDIGGSRNQMKMSSSPSIWDVDVIDRAIAQKDNGEKIREVNAQIAAQREENKQISRYQTIDGKSLQEQLENVDLRKDAGVHSLSGRDAVNYNQKIPVSGMSIFDSPEMGGKGDFSHIEKTEGEMLGERRRTEAAAKKANSRTWVEDAQKRKPANSSNSQFGQMIDSLLQGKKE